MASSKDYLQFILDQLIALPDITYKPMMGEFILYNQGKIFGGIYDNRLLVKPTASAAAMMPDAERTVPYPGAKEMFMVDNVDDPEFLRILVERMTDELPYPKSRK